MKFERVQPWLMWSLAAVTIFSLFVAMRRPLNAGDGTTDYMCGYVAGIARHANKGDVDPEALALCKPNKDNAAAHGFEPP